MGRDDPKLPDGSGGYPKSNGVVGGSAVKKSALYLAGEGGNQSCDQASRVFQKNQNKNPRELYCSM